MFWKWRRKPAAASIQGATLEEPLRTEVRLLLEADRVEDAIRLMRENGFFRIPTILALRDFAGMKPADAKMTVHHSETWADLREDAEALHDAAEAALDEIIEEQRKS